MDASYLSQQVNGIIVQLHGLFDEIGVSSHEREKREEELFNALSEALHNQVRLVTGEKQDMVDEAQRMITAIQQMETSLDGTRRRDYDNDDELQVTYPLTRCLQSLKEKHQQLSKIHRERYEQVRKLVDALESYSSHLESTFVRIPLPPKSKATSSGSSSSSTSSSSSSSAIPLSFDLSPTYVDKLDAEFSRVYEEYTRRVASVRSLAEQMIQLWAELGTPQAQTDAAIVQNYRDSPEQLGLHEEDLARLRQRRDKLSEEKKTRERRLRDLRAVVEDLWVKLGIDAAEQRSFSNSNRGCGLRQINEWEDELGRLQALKRQNLPAFVEDARCQLQSLWDVLYLSEDEMLAFTPAFSDVYSDALLEAHEREIARLTALRDQRAPVLSLVEKHRTLLQEREDLAASSQDASRLMMRGQKGEKRDPGKLLREEKMRKRIAKELPKVTVELRRSLTAWEDEYGRPFLVHGTRYLDTVDEAEISSSSRNNNNNNRRPDVRSKTPAGQMAGGTVKSVSKPTPGPSSAAASVRAPSRIGKTPTTGGTLKRNPLATTTTSTSTMATTTSHVPVPASGGRASPGRASPSRIPTSAARAPLGTLKTGGNSPERPREGLSHQSSASMLRSGLMRAPPPKMRDLHDLSNVPTLATPANPYRNVPLSGSKSSVHVRHVAPEDVYDDRPGRNGYSSFSQASTMPVTSQFSQASSSSSGSVRHISNSSTAVSGSENWETYDDNSEPEVDASDTYYAKMRAARAPKRMSPDVMGTGPKRIRGGGGGGVASAYAGHMLDERMVSSEWTDEEAF